MWKGLFLFETEFCWREMFSVWSFAVKRRVSGASQVVWKQLPPISTSLPTPVRSPAKLSRPQLRLYLRHWVPSAFLTTDLICEINVVSVTGLWSVLLRFGGRITVKIGTLKLLCKVQHYVLGSLKNTLAVLEFWLWSEPGHSRPHSKS